MPPSTLSPEEQKKVYHQLEDHFQVVMGAPCNSFPGYPFPVNWDKGAVKITAVIENFEEDQKKALVACFNDWFKSRGWGIFQAKLKDMLKAAPLVNCAQQGIQFKAGKRTNPNELMQEITEFSPCKDLWEHVGNYQQFLETCRINYFNNSPFGYTTARRVTFSADHGVPLCLMLYLLHALENQMCGFGQVVVVDCNGLPRGSTATCLHYASGLVHWGGTLPGWSKELRFW